tara:strand:+ start:263 stop:733 length:471 start_codon:yes stop_codon:yes gene_type:complete
MYSAIQGFDYRALVSSAVLVVTGTLFVVGVSGQVTADDIVGLWDTNDGAEVEIYERDGIYYGRFARFYDDPPAGGIDSHNPDLSLRTRSLVGADFILKFEFLDGKWKNGRIYNPENGKDYEADLELDGEVLKVRGWLWFRLLGRTVRWTRIAEEIL